jgi:Tfp pilus assembly protein PilO
MAETEKKNEWGAGLLAIGATVLIGAAIPCILYFILYKPQVVRKEEQKVRLTQMDAQLNTEIARGDVLLALQTEGEEVATKMDELEKRFSTANLDGSVEKLLQLLNANNLKRTPEAVVRREKSPIAKTDSRAEFPNGLQALMVKVVCYGQWKDFVTFIAAVESHKEATFVIGELVAEGDKNGKDDHTFTVDIWIVQGRNIAVIGRAPVVAPK